MSEIITIPIHILDKSNAQNPAKMPDLVGSGEIDGERFRVSIWTRWTQEQSRMYHSLAIAPPFDKEAAVQPEAYQRGLKLYEIRRATEADCQYQSPESFMLFGRRLWACFWTEPQADEAAGVVFRLEFRSVPFNQKPSKEAAELMA